jgi:hypothetical protein
MCKKDNDDDGIWIECMIDKWVTICLCFCRRLNSNKLNHFTDGTFVTLKQLQRLYACTNLSKNESKKRFDFISGISVSIDYELLKWACYMVYRNLIICKFTPKNNLILTIILYRQLDHNEISCIEPEAINELKRLEIM